MTQDENSPDQEDNKINYDLLLEEDEDHLETVKENNSKFMSLWTNTPYEERALFLPHCMRNSLDCKATTFELGHICSLCMKCQLGAITKEAVDLGIPHYIVPGGSMLMDILNHNKPTVSMGVACSFELAQAMEKMVEKECPMVGVLLACDGCKDTSTKVDEVLKMLRSRV